MKNILGASVKIFVLLLSDLFRLPVVACVRSIVAPENAHFAAVKNEPDMWEENLENYRKKDREPHGDIPSHVVLIIRPDNELMVRYVKTGLRLRPLPQVFIGSEVHISHDQSSLHVEVLEASNAEHPKLVVIRNVFCDPLLSDFYTKKVSLKIESFTYLQT